MKNKTLHLITAVLMFLMMSGFKSTAEKTFSLAAVYCVTAISAVIVFLIYIGGIKKKSPSFILLFTSIFVVNMGYFALAVSKSLEEALLANRISYLGSVFLPMAMLIIIMEAVKTPCKKWLTGLLTAVGIVVFLIAASPGYLDIYYKEVSFEIIDGVASLVKVYGPLHILYLFYLLIYFSSMIAIIVNAIRKKRISSAVQSFVLLASVFINIMVWLLEQLVKIDFEILSVSYVITEIFLVSMCFLLQESEKNQKAQVLTADTAEAVQKAELQITPKDFPEEKHEEITAGKEEEKEAPDFSQTEEYKNFMYGLSLLTATENRIYNCYIEGKSTKEILTLLDITENTLKYHNKNIYGKLGVSGRKQLKETAMKISAE